MPRPRRVWISPSVALLSMSLALAPAQEAGKAGQPAQDGSPRRTHRSRSIDMQQLLTLWEGQSEKLKTLELAIYRIDKDPAWGDEEHYMGRAAFKNSAACLSRLSQSQNAGTGRPKGQDKKVFVPVKKDNKLVSVPFETIVVHGPGGLAVSLRRRDRSTSFRSTRISGSGPSRKGPSPSCSTCGRPTPIGATR